MNIRWVALLVVSSCWTLAQPAPYPPSWERVDGGFRLIEPTQEKTRHPAVFVPSSLDRPILLRDTGSPRTELRVELDVDPALVAEPRDDFFKTVIDFGSNRVDRIGTGVVVNLTVPTTIRVRWRAGLLVFPHELQCAFTLLGEQGRAVWLVKSSDGLCEFDAQAATLSFTISGHLEATLLTTQPEGGDRSNPMANENPVFGNAGGRAMAIGTKGLSWEWAPDTTGWSARSLGPPGRARAALAWDSTRARLVAFGGSRGSTFFDDTWEFDGTHWEQHSPATRPPGRTAHQMAFDPLRGRTVLYGGIGAAGELGDMWEWDGVNWAQRTSSPTPGPRDAFGFAWDGNRQALLLFGGWDGAQALNDTWSWNGSQWEQLTPSTPPAARSSLAMTWDPSRQRVVMAGSLSTSATSSAEWNGTDWSPLGDLALRRGGLVHLSDAGTWALVDDRAWQLVGSEWVESGTYTGAAVAAGFSEDGGTVVFTDAGERLEWRQSAWRRIGPATNPVPLSMAVQRDGRMIALAQGSAGVTTWVSTGVGAWEERGAAPRGVLVADNDGVVWSVGNGSAARFTGTQWEPAEWPTNVSPVAVLRRPAGGFWAQAAGVFGVVEGATWKPTSSNLDAPVFLGIDGWPVGTGRFVTNVPVLASIRAAPDGGTTVGALSADPGPSGARFAGHDPTGAAMFFNGGAVRFSPHRSLGATCTAGWQCLGGVCADGRCCDRACGATTCEACSEARGASEDGVCTPVAADVCSPDAGAASEPDGGAQPPTPTPEPPAGCGCGAVDVPLVLLSLMALRARRRRREATLPCQGGNTSATTDTGASPNDT